LPKKSLEVNFNLCLPIKGHIMHDVVVIGAGPGGTAAAIACAQANLRVVLLEKLSFPRDRPGETLHPGVEPLLQQLGVWSAIQQSGFIRHPGIVVTNQQDQKFTPFGADESGPWLGFQAWRADFDAILLAQAHRCGVEIVQPCQALQPILTAGRVTGVQTDHGDFSARFTIDASGGNGWLAKHLAIGIDRLSPRLVARYGYVKGNCPARDEYPKLAIDPQGWTWTALVKPQIYQWTRLNLTAQLWEKDWRPAEFQSLTPFIQTRQADVTWRRAIAPAGPGYFIVGDAAHVLDPAAAHGVLKALMSGIMAAHLIGLTTAQHEDADFAASTYQKWLSDWFIHDMSKLREFYGEHFAF
jgi:2-polyprenyl-6-methoxyphenol hydroxylase-like FAD-dependent oxidoreductase